MSLLIKALEQAAKDRSASRVQPNVQPSAPAAPSGIVSNTLTAAASAAPKAIFLTTTSEGPAKAGLYR